MPSLHSPIQFGAITAPNRIFMAPLTRCRADAEHVPTDIMVEHYAQRASGGLLIAEATMAMEGNSSFWMEPGIYSAAQVAGWKKVTDAVHAAGGVMAPQLWHMGAVRNRRSDWLPPAPMEGPSGLSAPGKQFGDIFNRFTRSQTDRLTIKSYGVASKFMDTKFKRDPCPE